jgi:phage-related protein
MLTFGMARSVTFYRSDRGRCPVEEFLDSLPPKAAQKVTWVLRLVQELDQVPTQYLKKLTAAEEIWECRIVFGGNTYRFLGFFQDRNLVVLTHGFIKKTQKTPPQEVAEALRLKADYIRRHRHG